MVDTQHLTLPCCLPGCRTAGNWIRQRSRDLIQHPDTDVQESQALATDQAACPKANLFIPFFSVNSLKSKFLFQQLCYTIFVIVHFMLRKQNSNKYLWISGSRRVTGHWSPLQNSVPSGCVSFLHPRTVIHFSWFEFKIPIEEIKFVNKCALSIIIIYNYP